MIVPSPVTLHSAYTHKFIRSHLPTISYMSVVPLVQLAQLPPGEFTNAIAICNRHPLLLGMNGLAMHLLSIAGDLLSDRNWSQFVVDRPEGHARSVR